MRPSRRSVLSVVALLTVAVAACDKSAPALAEKVAELEAVSAQKDSLLQEVMSTTQFVGDLSADLASVRALTTGRPVEGAPSELEGLSPAERRAALRERVQELATRLEQSETKLTQSQQRVTQLTQGNARLRAQLAGYDSTIASLQVVLESQRADLAALSAQVQGLTEANQRLTERTEQLTAERTQLTEAVSTLTNAANQAYWVAGTEKELIERGIIQKRGGILGARATLVPARTLDPAAFTAIDITTDTILVFPSAEKPYRIVSLQDTRYLAVAPDRANRLRTGLQVTNALGFWGPSRFLILIED
jgi:predicted  nucleic acid-binding Zn-ribbon protein